MNLNTRLPLCPANEKKNFKNIVLIAVLMDTSIIRTLLQSSSLKKKTFKLVEHISVERDEQLQRIDYLWNMVRTKPVPDYMGFDQIYMINLERRPDRKFKMEKCFEEIGIKYKYVEAVDGK